MYRERVSVTVKDSHVTFRVEDRIVKQILHHFSAVLTRSHAKYHTELVLIYTIIITITIIIIIINNQSTNQLSINYVTFLRQHH